VTRLGGDALSIGVGAKGTFFGAWDGRCARTTRKVATDAKPACSALSRLGGTDGTSPEAGRQRWPVARWAVVGMASGVDGKKVRTRCV
jgi:hypothetical protein